MTKTQANILIALLVVLIGAVVNNTIVVGKPSINWRPDGAKPYLTNGARLETAGDLYRPIEYQIEFASEAAGGFQRVMPLPGAR